jgi:hypothetical protein
MKTSNFLLGSILILFVGFIFWMILTGKLGFLSGTFINGIWHSLENLVRPIFRR